MSRKVLIGMLAVFIAIALASLGYRFGQHLARSQATPSLDAPR